jgi:hypothetical protein
MATPRRLDPSDDSVGGFNDLENSVVAVRSGARLRLFIDEDEPLKFGLPNYWRSGADRPLHQLGKTRSVRLRITTLFALWFGLRLCVRGRGDWIPGALRVFQ